MMGHGYGMGAGALVFGIVGFIVSLAVLVFLVVATWWLLADIRRKAAADKEAARYYQAAPYHGATAQQAAAQQAAAQQEPVQPAPTQQVPVYEEPRSAAASDGDDAAQTRPLT